MRVFNPEQGSRRTPQLRIRPLQRSHNEPIRISEHSPAAQLSHSIELSANSVSFITALPPFVFLNFLP